MAMTHQERLELLKVAREAKAKKRLERLENEPPKAKGRPKKSLTLPVDPVENGDDDTKVVEDVITEYQTEVVKKPKRRIVKKIVYESNSDDEVIHEVEYKKSDKPKKIVKKDTPANPPPKEVKMKQNSATNLANMFFNY